MQCRIQLSPDNKVHGANMGPTWVLSVPDGPHVCPMNLAIMAYFYKNIVDWLNFPDNKGHRANMGSVWGRQDPGGPPVGPTNFAIWAVKLWQKLNQRQRRVG